MLSAGPARLHAAVGFCLPVSSHYCRTSKTKVFYSLDHLYVQLESLRKSQGYLYILTSMSIIML